MPVVVMLPLFKVRVPVPLSVKLAKGVVPPTALPKVIAADPGASVKPKPPLIVLPKVMPLLVVVKRLLPPKTIGPV